MLHLKQVDTQSWIQQPHQPGTVEVDSIQTLSTVVDAVLLNLKNPSVYRATTILEASGIELALVTCMRIAEAPDQLVIALRFESRLAAERACSR